MSGVPTRSRRRRSLTHRTCWRAAAAALLVVVGWYLFLSPHAFSERAAIAVADLYLEAEAAGDCDTVSRLTTKAEPCADLEQRAFSLSMMEQTGRWHAVVSHLTARAWTTLAGNVRVEYRLARTDQGWRVVERTR
ncbi:hypothetical protein GCM10022236_35200 [Microlunatus ginsengisoli]|uniref:DUF4878 domain-containing protein n=1 Tax=Microlunatus ginsengisoli TaxID=363863 RepID=A0ABP7ADB3_9ACTN